MPYTWAYLDTTMPTGAPAAQAVYQFDGTAESLDDRTGNGFNLTKIAGGALSYLSVEGITGLDFNDDIELQAPDSAALRHVGALTIELIIQPEEGDWWAGAYGCGAGGQNHLYAMRFNHFVHPAPGRWESMHEHGGKVDDNLAFTAGAPGGKDGRVALITLTRDSTGKIHRIYENGNFFEEQSTANAPDGVSTQRLHIGANNENNRWTGVIVGFRMTVARFTDAQVTEAADLVLTYTDPGTHPPSPNLLGLWRMDEGYGQNEPDASGNGHLMVVGASTTNWTADAPVDFARVCSANGHQWVCSTDVDDFNVQQFTLTGWVRKTTSGLGYLLHKDHGAKLRSWFVQISAAPFILTARIEFTDATNVTLNTTTVLDGVSDYHWAVTWDGSTALLYLDAIEEDRAELGPKTVDYQASQNVAIGNVNNTLEHPRSNVDSTAIYDVAQSPSWITGSKEMTLLDPIPQSAVRAAQIFVVSEDVIRIVFTSAVAVNSTFQNADSYSITDLTASEGVTVREVLPVLGSTSTFIPLRVRGLRSGRTYQLSISGSSVFDPDGDPVPAFTLNWLQARTKVDSVLNSLPMFYGTSIGVTLRHIVEAISITDEEIGGSQSSVLRIPTDE